MSINGAKLKTWLKKRELDKHIRTTVKHEEAKKRLADLKVKSAKEAELKATKAKINKIKYGKYTEVAKSVGRGAAMAGRGTLKIAKELHKEVSKAPARRAPKRRKYPKQATKKRRAHKKKSRKRAAPKRRKKPSRKSSYDPFAAYNY